MKDRPWIAGCASVCVACLVVGCTIVPHEPGSGSATAAGAANLIATPSKTPGTVAGCTVQITATGEQGGDAATKLVNSLQRVRNQTFFGDLALSAPPTPAAEFDEAWQLVEKAKASKAAKGGALDAAMQPDPTENILLALLPWAADTGAKPDDQQHETISNIAARARTLIGEVGGKPATLNQLLPPEAKPADTATARGGAGVTVKSFSPKDRSVFEKLTDLASFRAFHLLALMSAAHVHELANDPHTDAAQLDAEVRIFNIARYLSAYFDAYFRGGQFVQTSFDQQAFAASLSTRLAQRLKTSGLTAAQIQPVLLKELGKVCTSPDCASLQKGQTSFVTRAGLSVQFSGVTFAVGGGVSHTYPQVSQFGPQMIRVLVEAVYDANGQHPLGMPNSTACQPDQNLFDVKTECLAPNTAPDETLTQIDMLASASEALSQTATGALIRGLSYAALNNEAVAQMLETLAGVNARKITEKVLYIASNRGTCPLAPVALSINSTTSAVAPEDQTTTK